MVTNRYRPSESVRHRPAPVKFGSSGAGWLSARVLVAAGRVGLPDLDQGVRDRPAVAVEHPAGHDDPLADGLARVLGGQVGVGGDDPSRPSSGPVISVSPCGITSSGWRGARSAVER